MWNKKPLRWSGLHGGSTAVCEGVSLHYGTLAMFLWSQRVLIHLNTLRRDWCNSEAYQDNIMCAFSVSRRESLTLFCGLITESWMLAEVWGNTSTGVVFLACSCASKKLESLCASIEFGPLINQALRIQGLINNLEQSCVLQFLQSRLFKPKIAVVYYI